MTELQIELRKIISQMLANENINQTTLAEMVDKIIEEKAEKAIHTYLCQSNIGKLVRDKLEKEISSCMSEEIRKKINDYFSNIYVNISLNDKEND
jgi:hypothetical protein